LESQSESANKEADDDAPPSVQSGLVAGPELGFQPLTCPARLYHPIRKMGRLDMSEWLLDMPSFLPVPQKSRMNH
jgi:hypothetical protein